MANQRPLGPLGPDAAVTRILLLPHMLGDSPKAARI
jgi:hypothetical protein